ncbi:hypothetical protein B0O99DRAFT_593833 [Bisporella sp. PMI_857]|nr:hypothetical protein B0O99DRAFT_593833 [Bisporella sp. PMI_857]
MSILHSSSRRPPSLKPTDYDHEISLIDRTVERPVSCETQITSDRAASPISLSSSHSQQNSHTTLRKNTSLRKTIAQSRHFKYQDNNLGENTEISKDADLPSESHPGEDRGRGQNNLETGRKGSGDDAVIDILYENQRGGILCGCLPLFSGKALGNLDPAPWTNVAQKPSATNITNAQVPDPTWEWVWKDWFINRSDDVDDDGWEYSFMFAKAFSWHGPSWWNSFVRRRAWVRKRVKRHVHHRIEEIDVLPSEYYSLYPSTNRSTSRHSTINDVNRSRYSLTHSSKQVERLGEVRAAEKIIDIPHLMIALKAARIDREKMEAVENFIANSGDELYYIRDRMVDIMHSFIFQESRRLLLAHLLKILDEAGDEHINNLEKRKQPDLAEKRRLESLEEASKRADAEVRRLEFWSDVKDMAGSGETKSTVDKTQGWGDGWSGVDDSEPRDVVTDRKLPGKGDCDEGKLSGRANPVFSGKAMGSASLHELLWARVLIKRVHSVFTYERMSLGSRLAKRGRVAVIASLASTPRDPLLFLYPQWFRNSSSSAKPQTQPSFDFEVEDPSKHDLHQIIEKLQKDDQKPGIFERSLDVNSTHEGQNGQDGSRLVSRNIRRIETKTLWKPFRRISSPARSSEAQVRRIINTMDARSNEIERANNVRAAYKDSKREMTGSWEPDWREILAALSDTMPKNEQWLVRAVEISVPQVEYMRLMHAIDDTVWEISEKHGVSIDLDGHDGDNIEYRRFILSGTETAIHRTVHEILQAAPKSALRPRSQELLSWWRSIGIPGINPLALLSHDEVPTKGCDNSLQYFVSGRRVSFPATSIDKVPKPNFTDEKSIKFFDYITHLTNVPMTNHLHCMLYGKAKHHVFSAVERLKDAFHDPKYESSLSRAAFNTALRYCARSNQINVLRMLFARMELSNVTMSVETFNIMLEQAAKLHDLHNFHFITHMMLKRGVMPNGKTWAAFIVAVRDPRIKVHILNAMKERGYLRLIQNIESVAEKLTPFEIEYSLRKGQSQDEFISHMDTRYGPWWLTTVSGNHVLQAVGSRGLISRCWDLMFVMNGRAVRTDAVSVNTVLNHCKIMRNIAGALELLRSLPPSFGPRGFVPDQLTYQFLFEMAWRGRRYNLAKVVWRYACLNASTTPLMRIRVFESLKNSCLGFRPGESQRAPWYHSAGFFVYGFDNCFDHPRARFLGDVEESEPPISSKVLMEYRDISLLNFSRNEKAYGRGVGPQNHDQYGQIASVPSSDEPCGLSQGHIKDQAHSEPETSVYRHPTSAEHIQSQETVVRSPAGKWCVSAISKVEQTTAPSLDVSSLRTDKLLPQSRRPSVAAKKLAGTNQWPRLWKVSDYRKRFRAWLPVLKQFRYYDHKIFENWEPQKPFEVMLSEAWERDEEWKRLENEGNLEVKSMGWKLRNAITVPIQTKDQYKEAIRHEWK